MKEDNIQLTTSGKLLKDLKRYEKNHWDLSVVAWTDDDPDVISSLEDISKETRVYMAGEGYYFAIDGNGSSIFTEADDDDAVGCWVTVFGEYEEKEDEVEDSRVVDDARPKGWKGILEVFTYLLVILLSAYGLYYNITALVKPSGPVWESLLWIPFLLLLLWVCIDGLFRLHTID